MKQGAWLLVLLAAIGSVPARGDDARPLLLPRHDVSVTYHVTSSAHGAPDQVRIISNAGAHKLRIEPDGQPGYALIDRDAGTGVMLLTGAHLLTDVKIGGVIDRYLNDPQAQFRKLGAGSVAGRACTRWAMHSPQADGEGCVTADGVILSAEGHDSKNARGSIQALSVDDAAVPDSVFAVPAGYHHLDLSNLGGMLKMPK